MAKFHTATYKGVTISINKQGMLFVGRLYFESLDDATSYIDTL